MISPFKWSLSCTNEIQFSAVQEERGPRKTTRLRKLISNYSDIGSQKMKNKKNETDDKPDDLTYEGMSNLFIWSKYDMLLFIVATY